MRPRLFIYMGLELCARETTRPKNNWIRKGVVCVSMLTCFFFFFAQKNYMLRWTHWFQFIPPPFIYATRTGKCVHDGIPKRVRGVVVALIHFEAARISIDYLQFVLNVLVRACGELMQCPSLERICLNICSLARISAIYPDQTILSIIRRHIRNLVIDVCV